ncbi:MAG: nucleotide-binding protein [Pseudomonadota bacterium]
MARRSTTERPQRPVLSVDQKRRSIEKLLRRIQELEVFDPQKVQKRWPPEVTAIETSIDEALSAVFGHGTVEYNRYSRATTLDHGPVVMGSPFGDVRDDTFEARQYLAEGKQESILMLKQAIKVLEEEIADQEYESSSTPPVQPSKNLSRKVFVVHGHDHGARDAVARFLEKIELNAIILQEQPDQGLTIIEKFENYAAQVGFAVVLLTPDDLGGVVSGSAQATRARQNVIFELGFFVGKLGRGRACLLRKGDIEIPSDLYGVIYTDLDAAEGWKLKLVKELKAAGLSFDANKVWA